jgi:FMN phosphatase YigB (HAD superfamily)
MLKAILFDLDDTLLDWSGFHGDWLTFERPFVRRVFDYIASVGHALDSFDAFYTEFRTRTSEGWRNGRGTLIAPNVGDILVAAAEACGAPAGALDARACLEAYGWTAIPGTRIFEEVFETLELLCSDFKFAIVTNAYQPMWMRDQEIGAHGLLPFFPDCRISAADVGYLKPHPSMFQRALDELGVSADEAIFVGDNPIADVAGAQAAGMRAVLRVLSPAPNLLSGLIVPDAAVNSLRELPLVIDQFETVGRNT